MTSLPCDSLQMMVPEMEKALPRWGGNRHTPWPVDNSRMAYSVPSNLLTAVGCAVLDSSWAQD